MICTDCVSVPMAALLTIGLALGARVRTKRHDHRRARFSGLPRQSDGTEMELSIPGCATHGTLAFNEAGDLLPAITAMPAIKRALGSRRQGGDSGWRNGWEMRACSSLEPRWGSERGRLGIRWAAPRASRAASWTHRTRPSGDLLNPGTGSGAVSRLFSSDFPAACAISPAKR